jgi:hypothetical protein
VPFLIAFAVAFGIWLVVHCNDRRSASDRMLATPQERD